MYPYVGAVGRAILSPDGRYMAHASTITDRGFWGDEHTYYEFAIESPQQQRIRTATIKESVDGLINWQRDVPVGDGFIQWASDSSSVTYTLRAGQFTMRAPQVTATAMAGPQ